MELFKKNTKQEEELQSEVKKLKELIIDGDRARRSIDKDHELKIIELESEHNLALKEKAFELKHLKDEEIKKAKDEVIEMTKKLAVLTKENEMLKSITDVNADIIDVKDLVSKLVEKLPTIDLKSLTINNTDKK